MNVKRNESLCLEIQAGRNADLCLAQLVKNNAEAFDILVKQGVAEALKKNAVMSPDEIMGEALRGFRRAAEAYKPFEHDVNFMEYASYWVKYYVRLYVRSAERGTLPPVMLKSVLEYRKIMNLVHTQPAAGHTLEARSISALFQGAVALCDQGTEVAAIGVG